MRLFLALLFGKGVRFLSKKLNLGEGSNYPGHIAQKIDPDILKKLNKDSLKIMITGTNGKTTTASMIAAMLKTKGHELIHNDLGSNLTGGIISSIIMKTNILGTTKAQFSVFETDEGTVPNIISDIQPQIVVVTNIFKDQLDRYGETQRIYDFLHESFKKLSSDSVLILNSDDPLCANLNRGLDNETLYYGIHDTQLETQEISDPVNCFECGEPYNYRKRYINNLGNYFCPECGETRPQADIYASNIDLNSHSSSFELKLPENKIEVNLKIPALYNIYNFTAASACAHAAGLKKEGLLKGISGFKPVFGRMEKLYVENREINLILVKNPAGFNEVLKLITNNERKIKVCILINDNEGDGEDPSWLWDVNFEMINSLEKVECIAGGMRAEDVALCLKYSGLENIKLFEDITTAFYNTYHDSQRDEHLYILPNYTALFELKSVLEKQGILKQNREESR